MRPATDDPDGFGWLTINLCVFVGKAQPYVAMRGLQGLPGRSGASRLPSPLRTGLDTLRIIRILHPTTQDSRLLVLPLLCRCWWQDLCKCIRFSVSSVPPSFTRTIWCVCSSSPLNSCSPHTGQNHFCRWAIFLSFEPSGQYDLPYLEERSCQYLRSAGSSGDEVPLTFTWRSIGIELARHI